MQYRPAGRPISHSAARRAPRAKVIRSVARWVISTRSPAARKGHGVLPHDVARAQSSRNRCCRARAARFGLSGRRSRPLPSPGRERLRPRRPMPGAVPDGRRVSSDGAPRRFPHHKRGPSPEAAIDTNLATTLTPTLVLGSMSTGMSLAVRSRRPRVAASNPVVPTRIGHPPGHRLERSLQRIAAAELDRNRRAFQTHARIRRDHDARRVALERRILTQSGLAGEATAPQRLKAACAS